MADRSTPALTNDMDFVQASFAGGLNQQVDPTRLGPNEYPLLICGRSRYDTIEPTQLPVADPSVPAGNVQAVFAAGQYGVVLVDGKAYYRDYRNPNSAYIRIDRFQMDAATDRMWAALVPASTINFLRFSQDGNPDVPQAPSSGVSLGALIAASPQALIVQDGINQAWIIDSNAQARVTKSYEQWSLDDHEYVPIGRQMLFQNAILYTIWAKDRSTILRSVSGRPLDFMVNITPNGDKPAPTEIDGGAQTTSHSVGYGEVTCLADLNSPDGGFFVGQYGRSTKVVPDFSTPLFGEPQFDNASLFPTGPLNQNCFTDILGDSVFIDFAGARSFNAVMQFRNEGKNSPFSAKVQRLLKGIVQTNPCVGKFDNYALFAMQTIYGPGVLLYDEIAQTYAGLDIWPGVGPIKQFAEIKADGVRKLLFIDGQRLYEAYTGATAKLQFYAGEWCSKDPKVAQTPQVAKVVLSDVVGSGTITVTPFINQRRHNPKSEPVKGTGVLPTSTIPFDGSKDNVRMLTFNIGRVQSGWKVGLFIETDFQCAITAISVESENETQDVAPGQAAINLARLRA